MPSREETRMTRNGTAMRCGGIPGTSMSQCSACWALNTRDLHACSHTSMVSRGVSPWTRGDSALGVLVTCTAQESSKRAPESYLASWLVARGGYGLQGRHVQSSHSQVSLSKAISAIDPHSRTTVRAGSSKACQVGKSGCVCPLLSCLHTQQPLWMTIAVTPQAGHRLEACRPCSEQASSWLCHQRRKSIITRRHGVEGCRHNAYPRDRTDLEFAILALGEPGPAAAKLGGARSLELLLELVQGAKVPVNGLLQLALRLLCACAKPSATCAKPSV